MTLVKKVEALEKTVKDELKEIYKSVMGFKVNIDILMDTVEKLNKYTHDRIHYLTSTDVGVERILIRLQDGYKTMQDDIKAIKDFGSDMRKRVFDSFFRVVTSTVVIFISMVIGGHWLKW